MTNEPSAAIVVVSHQREMNQRDEHPAGIAGVRQLADAVSEAQASLDTRKNLSPLVPLSVKRRGVHPALRS